MLRMIVIAVVGLWAATLVAAQEQAVEEVAEPLPVLEVTDPEIPSDVLDVLLVPLTGADLSELAETWQGHLKDALQETADLNNALRDMGAAEARQARVDLADATATQGAIRDNYGLVLSAWDRKGATDEELAPHQAYLNALKVDAVRTTDARTLFVVARDWLFSWTGGLGLILKGLGMVLAIWILMFLARIVRRTVAGAMDNLPMVSHLLKAFIVNSVYWGVFVLGVLVVLGLFGVNVTPLFAVFGGLSFILGFALQETLGNLASGLMIMVLKPFDTGDYIEIGGSSGYVDEMSVVSTKIRTFDNQIIVVPNSKIWGDVITNVSASDERRVDLVFGIAYSDSAAHAIEVLQGLVAKHELCLTDPAPEIFVGELGDNSVNVFCRPWGKTDDYWTVFWDLTGQAKEQFDAEGISIPFPQRDVHLIPADPA